MFNVSSSVDGWVELRIAELGLHHRQRVSINVSSSTAHLVTTATQVQFGTVMHGTVQFSIIQHITHSYLVYIEFCHHCSLSVCFCVLVLTC